MTDDLIGAVYDYLPLTPYSWVVMCKSANNKYVILFSDGHIGFLSHRNLINRFKKYRIDL